MADTRRTLGSRRRRRLALGLAASTLMALGFARPAAAQDCGALASLELPQGRVDSAETVAAGSFEAPPAMFGPPPGLVAATFERLPQFCRVRATLTPSADSDIKVEIWLPASGWNGKFVGIGNGIWAGSISYFQMADPLARGYAVAATDTGHVGDGLTGDFAVGHPEKLVDFGYRAVHEMTVAAKRAIAAYYGSGPKLSLWNSCSTGGRQGLMSAYRYPEDYDAISAMAPANPMTGLMTQTIWTGYQALRTPTAGLSLPKLTAVHRAYVAQCDARDGLKDGLVSDPRSCSFDPATIRCRAGDSDDCLTGEQVQTLRAIYDGVRDSRTGARTFPGFPPGAEIQLAALIAGPEPFSVATSYMRSLVFADPRWDFRSFDYGADADRARDYGEATLDVPATGLSSFFARGGKLLLSHGWQDGLIPASNTILFHDELRAVLPERRAAEQLRLFMAPGMDHCAGGEGPSVFDTLDVIDRWASEGRAPDRIVATRAPGQPSMSRPLCPFPQVARYHGEGDAADAGSFDCAAP